MKLKVLKDLGVSNSIFYRVGDVVEPSKAEAATLLTNHAEFFDIADEEAAALKAAIVAGAKYATVEHLKGLVTP